MKNKCPYQRKLLGCPTDCAYYMERTAIEFHGIIYETTELTDCKDECCPIKHPDLLKGLWMKDGEWYEEHGGDAEN